ncbi:hypothetical protein [Laribacter hongkongensis]
MVEVVITEALRHSVRGEILTLED